MLPMNTAPQDGSTIRMRNAFGVERNVRWKTWRDLGWWDVLVDGRGVGRFEGPYVGWLADLVGKPPSELIAEAQMLMRHCHSDRDGDCSWSDCPQLRDNEPAKSGRHCPLVVDDDED